MMQIQTLMECKDLITLFRMWITQQITSWEKMIPYSIRNDMLITTCLCNSSLKQSHVLWCECVFAVYSQFFDREIIFPEAQTHASNVSSSSWRKNNILFSYRFSAVVCGFTQNTDTQNTLVPQMLNQADKQWDVGFAPASVPSFVVTSSQFYQSLSLSLWLFVWLQTGAMVVHVFCTSGCREREGEREENDDDDDESEDDSVSQKLLEEREGREKRVSGA